MYSRHSYPDMEVHVPANVLREDVTGLTDGENAILQ